MRTFLKYLAIVLIAVFVAGSAYGAWFFLIDTGAPPKRPDLVRLPEDAPPSVPGYPTENALRAAYVLGQLKLYDTKADFPVPPTVVAEYDVEYGRVGDRPLLLNLYKPKELQGPVPGLIFIHGGGWSKGDKKDYTIYCHAFAERGYVVASIGYRFAQEAKFPGCVEDTKCAVRWMRENAEALGVDPDKIVAIGGSAGGYLAMMAGYSSDVPELEGNGGHAGVSSAVAGVVNLYGPCDFTTEEAKTHPTITGFMPQSYAEAPGTYKLASPINHVDRKDPPTFILHGTTDQILTVLQSDALAEKFQQEDMPYWYDRVDGWPHTMDLAVPVNARTQFLIQRFIEEFILKDGDPSRAL